MNMEEIKRLVNEYLKVFPEEQNRQAKILEYLNNENNKDAWNDWNNFDGHFVAGGFIYSKKENKILVIYHKDLKMYLHPGGHVDKNDINILEAAKREVFEETNIDKLVLFNVSENECVPLDIDMHEVPYNKMRNLPKHIHFEFRYLFVVDNISQVKIDTDEILEYKWIDLEEFGKDLKYKNCFSKIKEYIDKI